MTGSNVISLTDKLLDRGEANFAVCPYGDGQSSFVPIVRRNSTGDFISALLCVCPYCNGDGVFMQVNNGYIGPPEE